MPIGERTTVAIAIEPPMGMQPSLNGLPLLPGSILAVPLLEYHQALAYAHLGQFRGAHPQACR